MDLGIRGRTALVCAASKGLGRGCASAVAQEGVNVTIMARTASELEATADEIRRLAPDVTVTAVVGDITTPDGRQAALAVCPAPDILVTNAGGPPPGDFHDWSREDWIKALDANMLTPIELIKATVDGMMERGFGRIVNITSSAVKAPIDILGLSNGARSGLTGFMPGFRAPQSPGASRSTISSPVPSRPTACVATPRSRQSGAVARLTKNSPPWRSPTQPGGSATRTSSAPHVSSCVVCMLASSRARTGSWTAEPILERSEVWRAE